MVEPAGQRAEAESSEAGGGVEGTSDHGDAGGWQSRRARGPSAHHDGGLRASRGAARRQRWRRQEWVGGQAFSRSRHWRALWRRGHWSALSRSKHWRALWRSSAGWDQRRRRRLRRAGLGICGPPWAKLGKWSPFSSVVAQSTLHTQLTLSRGAGGGAPLRAHTVRGILPRGGRCCRLTHLV